ncbi:DUF6474 family protein [Saccharopolyspora sp. NPDC000359]|uniref:DUF6474 family protein n=1 Tax=Saccharopolyspora sp. NPDC000359 TaxID=3154251 RepID=UPI00331EF42E
MRKRTYRRRAAKRTSTVHLEAAMKAIEHRRTAKAAEHHRAAKAAERRRAAKAAEHHRRTEAAEHRRTVKAAEQRRRTEATEHRRAVKAAERRKSAEVAEQRKLAKAELKADKRAAKAIKKGEHGRITPGNAKKVIGVAKVVGPVLLPFAVRAASAARDTYDRARARRLGVPVDDLGTFTGHGAALHARIAGDTEALRALREQAGDQEARLVAEQYAERTGARLMQLTTAVRAAERMPTQRRRSTHRAVNAELNQIEGDLLSRFGINPKH